MLAECVVSFVRRLVSDRPLQLIVVVPMHPFHGLPFELAFGFPRAEMLDDFRLEQSDDGFGQCFVVAVSDASNRHFASGFGEPFGVSDGHAMHAAVRVVGQRVQCRTPLADGLAEGVEDESGVGRSRRGAHLERFSLRA